MIWLLFTLSWMTIYVITTLQHQIKWTKLNWIMLNFMVIAQRSRMIFKYFFHNLCSRFKPILFPALSILMTLTSTLWPNCKSVLFMLELWISPSLPTPMSTKAPKWVTLVTFPVSLVPSLRLAISRIPSLNRGCISFSTRYYQ